MARVPVLIVEDDADIANLVRFHLEKEGFATRIAASGTAALAAIDKDPPQAILLDIMLPDLDGFDVCRRLKRSAATRDIPIIMVTSKGEESDVVVGLELGAEDYITKPFSPKVLVARVRAVLRRHETEPSGQLTLLAGDIVIDPARHAVKINGQDVDLTLTQYKLLAFLASRPGFVRTRDQMVAAVRGEDAVLSSRAIDVHIAALRQKLGAMGEIVETVRGVGYRLSDQKPAAAR
jgi:two-component system alkaline phosphatase synthesis response regulator PhoP